MNYLLFQLIKNEFDVNYGSPTAATFIQDKLDEIVNLRHSIEHTSNVSNIGRLGVKRYL